MVESKIIFLGGIHGVGKSIASEFLCDKLKLEYLSASGLIKWNDINEDINNKTVVNILSTQELLINALSIRCLPKKAYLLDGHYCLLNEKLEPVRIDFEVFEKIKPSVLLVLKADAILVQERLKLRDGKEYNINTLENLQNMEIEYAQEISQRLNIDFYCIDSNISKISDLSIEIL